MEAIDVERLLRWAFVMELTKRDHDDRVGPASGGVSSWAIVERIGELGTMVDGSGTAPCAHGDPHPDALTIERAVTDLDEATVREGDDHDLFAGWGDLGEAGEVAIARAWEIVTFVEGDGRRVMRSPLSALVRRVAILGRWPDWRGEKPEIELAERNGKPLWFRMSRVEVQWTGGVPTRWADVEIDGYDRVRRRPHRGAYRKSVLSHDVAPVLARRIEYGLTHAALVTLASELDGLGERRVLPPVTPAVPWAESEVEKIVA